MSGWVRFRCSNSEVATWIGDNSKYDDRDIEVFLRNIYGQSQLLIDKGTKITNRGGGWYVVYGYAYDKSDMPKNYPGRIYKQI
jgi:hypothetical protein